MEQTPQESICILQLILNALRHIPSVAKDTKTSPEHLILNSLSGFSKEHEYLLIGSIPDAKNTITVTLTDTNGKQVDSITWSYQAPKLSAVINISALQLKVMILHQR